MVSKLKLRLVLILAIGLAVSGIAFSNPRLHYIESKNCKPVSLGKTQTYKLRAPSKPIGFHQLILNYHTEELEFGHGAPRRINKGRAKGGQLYRSATGPHRVTESLPSQQSMVIEFLSYSELGTYRICDPYLTWVQESTLDTSRREFLAGQVSKPQDVLKIDTKDIERNLRPSDFKKADETSSIYNSAAKGIKVGKILYVRGYIENLAISELIVLHESRHIEGGVFEAIFDWPAQAKQIGYHTRSPGTKSGDGVIDHVGTSHENKRKWSRLQQNWGNSDDKNGRRQSQSFYTLRHGSVFRHRPFTDAELPPLKKGMRLASVEPWAGVELNIDEMRFSQSGASLDQQSVEVIFDIATEQPNNQTAPPQLFRYDNSQKEWIVVAEAAADLKAKTIKGRVEKSGKYISAYLIPPETPEGHAYTPNFFAERDPAKPTDNLTIVQPPSANQTGDATLQYPIDIPRGRNGMQPSLALSYNSSGGNGFAGMGWDLQLGSISLETRWGYPLFDEACETETYLLDGKQLLPAPARLEPSKIGVENTKPFLVRNGRPEVGEADECKVKELDENSSTIGKDGRYRDFRLRVDDQFVRARRHGNSPSNYYWSVENPNGKVRYYGRIPELFLRTSGEKVKQPTVTGWFGTNKEPLKGCSPDLRSNKKMSGDGESSFAIASWPLVMEEDVNGNTVVYCYKETVDPLHGGDCNTGKFSIGCGRNLYIERIFYTGSVKRWNTSSGSLISFNQSIENPTSTKVAHRIGPYSVEFGLCFRGEHQNSDNCLGADSMSGEPIRRFSMNTGFPRYSAYALKNVDVSFLEHGVAPPKIRTFEFNYQLGYGNKILLKNIQRRMLKDDLLVAWRGTLQESDKEMIQAYGSYPPETPLLSDLPMAAKSGDVFEEHKFQYAIAPTVHNQSGGAGEAFCKNGGGADFKTCRKYHIEENSIKTFVSKSTVSASPFGDFNGTALSGTRSRSFNKQLYTGLSFDSGNKDISVGATFAQSGGKSIGVHLHTDLDGDGVADWSGRSGAFLAGGPKAPTRNSNVAEKYRSSLIYGDQKSESNSTALQLFVKPFSAGTNSNRSKATTRDYTLDVNGDGWQDVVKNGKVYFAAPKINQFDQLEISFGSSSSSTPVSFELATREVFPPPAASGGCGPVDGDKGKNRLFCPDDIVMAWTAPIHSDNVEAEFVTIPNSTNEVCPKTTSQADIIFELSIRLPNTNQTERIGYAAPIGQDGGMGSIICKVQESPKLKITTISSSDQIVFQLNPLTDRDLHIAMTPSISKLNAVVPDNLHPAAIETASFNNDFAPLSNKLDFWSFPECPENCPEITDVKISDGHLFKSKPTSDDALLTLVRHRTALGQPHARVVWQCDITADAVFTDNLHNDSIHLRRSKLCQAPLHPSCKMIMSPCDADPPIKGDRFSFNLSSQSLIDWSKIGANGITFSHKSEPKDLTVKAQDIEATGLPPGPMKIKPTVVNKFMTPRLNFLYPLQVQQADVMHGKANVPRSLTLKEGNSVGLSQLAQAIDAETQFREIGNLIIKGKTNNSTVPLQLSSHRVCLRRQTLAVIDSTQSTCPSSTSTPTSTFSISFENDMDFVAEFAASDDLFTFENFDALRTAYIGSNLKLNDGSSSALVPVSTFPVKSVPVMQLDKGWSVASTCLETNEITTNLLSMPFTTTEPMTNQVNLQADTKNNAEEMLGNDGLNIPVPHCSAEPPPSEVNSLVDMAAYKSPINALKIQPAGILQTSDGKGNLSADGIKYSKPNVDPTDTMGFSAFEDPAYSVAQGSGLTGTGTVTAPKKVSRSNQMSFSFGVSPASLAVGKAKHGGVTEFMDINGDRSPDPMVSGGNCEISLPFGSRISGASRKLCPKELRKSISVNANIGMGGNFAVGKSDSNGGDGASTTRNSDKAQTTSQSTALGSLGLSGGGTVSITQVEWEFGDVNGDGLIDRYKPSKGSLAISFNMGPGGYSNTVEVKQQNDIRVGEGIGCGLSLGASYNDGIYGFAGGYNLNRNLSQGWVGFVDYDADGLTDVLSIGSSVRITNPEDLADLTKSGKLLERCVKLASNKNNSNFTLYRNLGDRFDTRGEILRFPNDKGAITLGSDRGQSLGLYFTIPIPLPVPKLGITINPGVDFSESFGTQKIAIRDIDGFGMPDLASADDKGNFAVRTNILEKTPINLLTQIEGPLGAITALDYEKLPPTVDMPSARWVLSGVVTDDGVAGDGKDQQLTRFNYFNGRQDRSERAFLGFERVIEARFQGEPNSKKKESLQTVLAQSRMHQACQDSRVVRAIERKYSNRTIYAKAHLLEEKIGKISKDCTGIDPNETYIKTSNSYAVFDAGSVPYDLMENAARAEFVRMANVRQPATDAYEGHKRRHVFLYESRTDFMEPKTGGASLTVSSMQRHSKYDIHGNLLEFEDFGRGVVFDSKGQFDRDDDRDDNLKVHIEYLTPPASGSGAPKEPTCLATERYILDRPGVVEVKNNAGRMLRRREANYGGAACLLSEVTTTYRAMEELSAFERDAIDWTKLERKPLCDAGNRLTIAQRANCAKASQTRILYDSENPENPDAPPLFGNIVEVVGEKPDQRFQTGLGDGRVRKKFEYDPVIASNAVRIADGFGLASTFSYDLAFSTPVCMSDPNRRAMAVQLDGVGRATHVWFPYHQQSRAPPKTIHSKLQRRQEITQFPGSLASGYIAPAADRVYLGTGERIARKFDIGHVCFDSGRPTQISYDWFKPNSESESPQPLSRYVGRHVETLEALRENKITEPAKTAPIILTRYQSLSETAPQTRRVALTRRLNLDPESIVPNGGNKLSEQRLKEDFAWLDTALFSDGIGRTIQTRSEARIAKVDDSGLAGSADAAFIVSGLKVYDGLGRVVRSHHPQNSTNGAVSPEALWNQPSGKRGDTHTRFDLLDRPVETSLPFCRPNMDGFEIDIDALALIPAGNQGNPPKCSNPADRAKISYDYSISTSKLLRPLPYHDLLTQLGVPEETTNPIPTFITTKTDPNGNEQRTTADARGLTVAVKECHVAVDVTALDLVENTDERPIPVSCQFDGKGGETWETRYSYDAAMQISAVIKQPIGAEDTPSITLSGYDERGLRLRINNSDSGLIESRFDAAGNMVESITPELRAQDRSTRHIYRRSRLEQIRHANHADESDVLYCYADPESLNPDNDAKLHPLCREPFASLKQVENRIAAATHFNQMGRAVRVVVGDIARVKNTGQRSALLRFESRRYGPLGELVRQDRHLPWSEGHHEHFVTLMRYDHLNRVREMVYPDGERLSYRYDKGGQVRHIAWKHYRRKPGNSGISSEGSVPGFITPYTGVYLKDQLYDKFGKVVARQLGNGICSFWRFGRTTRRLSLLESYRPDTKGGAWPVGLASWNCNETDVAQRLVYRYDKVGNILQIADIAVPEREDPPCGSKIGCNTSSPNPVGGWQKQKFAYDSLHRLVWAKGNLHSTPRLTGTEVSDKDKTSWSPNAGSRHTYTLGFRYDALHRIRSKTQAHIHKNRFGYERRQRRTTYSHLYEYGGKSSSAPLHAPTKIGRMDVGYDRNGNMISQIVPSAFGTQPGNHHGFANRRLYWDDQNRLRAVHDNGVVKGRYLYDEGGTRLIKRTKSADSLYVNEYFVTTNRGNGRAVKQVMAGGTRIAARVVNHDLVDIRPDAARETYFYHSDHLGSVGYITDDLARTYQHVAYFPTGEVWVEQPDESELIPYRFSGKELDRETGYQYFGARYYNPRLSLWPSVDPALAEYLDGDPAGGVFSPRNLSAYAYSANSPVVFYDADGRAYGVISKIIKITIKGGDIASTLQGMKDDFGTLADSSTSVSDKSLAVISLLSEVVSPVSLKDVKSAGMVLKAANNSRKRSKINKISTPKIGQTGGKGANKKFGEKVKKQARMESGNKCVFCGDKTTLEHGPKRSEIDHAFPKSRGGNNTISNAQNTCKTCNREKRDLTTKEYLIYRDFKNVID